MKRKVLVRDLKPGMFVSELDRPWVDTPYMLQGRLIRSEKDVEQMAQFCEHVFIDELRGQENDQPKGRPERDPAAPSTPEEISFRGKTPYADAHPVEKELPLASEARETAVQILTSVKLATEKGLNLDVEQVRQAVDGLCESIIRNPDALMFLAQLRNTRSSIYDRAINVAVYLLAFGRYLALTRQELSELGFGGLLMDVGKLKLPAEFLDKTTPFARAEHSLFKKHVAFGEAMVQGLPGVTARVRHMIAQHHEREDGSGYPAGLRGTQLSPHGKMAAIVDAFEELVMEKPYGRPFPPHEALQLLQTWGGRFFHKPLVEQFIQCTGVYPVGSLVELTTGAVGIVVAQNRRNRLQPRILLVLDTRKKPYPAPKIVDLLKDRENEYGVEYEIGRSLEFGMYGIDPKDYYL
ncbi:MAG TPA: HD domain-containing phosphohydrolase [Burkholderiales bacterium]